MKSIIIICLVCLLSSSAYTQIIDSAAAGFLFKFNTSYNLPGGDLAKRFGNNFSIGVGTSYKTKCNFLFGIRGDFLFGNRVKEDTILNSIATSGGYIINSNGGYADITLSERGFMLQVQAGKILPFFAANDNSGIVFLLSAGLLQHKIRIELDDDNVPSLNKEYRKGYDRLTNGVAISEFIGYLFLGKRKRVNFYAGFELTQAWTKNRRSWNFDTMKKDNTPRNDYLFGIKAGLILPLYRRKTFVEYN